MIETARLRLRPWREDDRPSFGALLNSPEMTRHLGGPASDGELRALFDKRLEDQRLHGCCYWATELRSCGELVGTCGLRVARDYPDTPVAGMVEAGWRIGEAHWRRGYALEAMTAALEWGWRNLYIDRIAAWTIAENTPSLGVMQRLGMVPDPALDFVRPMTGEACLVYIANRPGIA